MLKTSYAIVEGVSQNCSKLVLDVPGALWLDFCAPGTIGGPFLSQSNRPAFPRRGPRVVHACMRIARAAAGCMHAFDSRARELDQEMGACAGRGKQPNICEQGLAHNSLCAHDLDTQGRARAIPLWPQVAQKYSAACRVRKSKIIRKAQY